MGASPFAEPQLAWSAVFKQVCVTTSACEISNSKTDCVVRGLKQVRLWLEEGSVLSEPTEHFRSRLWRVPAVAGLQIACH